jgi:hypothetical protein
MAVVLALAGCDDPDEVQIGLRPGDPTYCEPTLDAATPLGITGGQLFALYSAEFDTTVLRQGGRVAPETQLLHVRIAQREEQALDAVQCWRVAVPVTVVVTGPGFEHSQPGALSGTPLTASITFGEDYPNIATGAIRYDHGKRTFDMSKDGFHWSDQVLP